MTDENLIYLKSLVGSRKHSGNNSLHNKSVDILSSFIANNLHFSFVFFLKAEAFSSRKGESVSDIYFRSFL